MSKDTMAVSDRIDRLPLLLTYEAARRELGISKTMLHGLINAGKLPTVTLGPQTKRIPQGALVAYVEQMLSEGGVVVCVHCGHHTPGAPLGADREVA